METFWFHKEEHLWDICTVIAIYSVLTVVCKQKRKMEHVSPDKIYATIVIMTAADELGVIWFL